MSVEAGARSRVLVSGAEIAPAALELLRDFEVVFAGAFPTEDDLVRLCNEHQPIAIILRYGKITGRVMDASRNLRVVSKHGAGIDSIDVKAAAARNIAVRAAAGANAPAVAEHAWALILACAKSVTGLDARMRAGHWDKARHKSLELKGRTLGLVGLGAIGRRVALAGLAFEMRVLAHDPVVTEAPAGVTLTHRDRVIAEADVLSLHCPMTADNAKMVDRATIARMRDGAILINTARGGLVDEEALADALRSGKIRAAGLDTFATEPVVGRHPLSEFPQVVLSPHIGGVTTDAFVAMGTGAARNVLAVLAGEAR